MVKEKKYYMEDGKFIWKSKPIGYKMKNKPIGYKTKSKPIGYKTKSKPIGYKTKSKPIGYKTKGNLMSNVRKSKWLPNRVDKMWEMKLYPIGFWMNELSAQMGPQVE